MALISPRPANRPRHWHQVATVLTRLCWFVGCAALVVGGAASSPAQTPLYEQRPFDRITLDQANDNQVLDVLPLNTEFPDRQLPAELPRGGKLVIEPVDEPGVQYECYWRNIVKVELFEQLILNEVDGLVRARRFEDAYQYFVQLENEKPDLPGLQEAIDNYLYEEAKTLHLAGQYDGALARLREIYSRSPQRQGLDRALGAATEKLVEKEVSAGQHWIARSYLDNLAKMYPQQPTVTSWRARLQEMAAVQLAEARRNIDEKRLREAHAAIRQVTAIWPELPGVEEVRRTIVMGYPRYVVGVQQSVTVAKPGRLNDWAARRTGRLVERTLLEFVGPGTEGGKYICPVGEMKTQDLSRRLEFELRTDIALGGVDTVLTGYDLTRQFLAMADPESPQYLQIWADLLESVSVDQVFKTIAQLRRPFVLPQAMLQTSITTRQVSVDGVETNATIGPYFLDSSQDGESVFLINTSYFAGAASRPKEIVEQRFSTGGDMVNALRRGDIDVVDRINLWELDKFRGLNNVEVKRYSVPLIHCLIPNPQGPLSSRRAFRRALTYGINREAILRLLVHGTEIPGCEVISGPFSPGVTLDDPLDYAYDKSIEPRSYEPHLAVALAEVALKELAEAEKKKENPLKEIPQTVLAHPPTEMARMAVRQIQRQLKLVGIDVQLRELGPEIPDRIPDDVDLLYAELAMWEPIVDAERLLGERGIMGEASPYMRQALIQLRQSVDWPTVGRQLRRIHQLAHSEVTIIPLWQLSDYFAHVRELEGIGDSPATLYQYVDEWQATPQTNSNQK